MSGNGEYGTARESVLAEIHEHARALASEGLPAHEIVRRLDDRLTATERELLGGIVRRAVAESRRAAAQRMGSTQHVNFRRPQSIAGGTHLLAARKQWAHVRRWASAQVEDGGTWSVIPVVPVVIAAVAAGVLVGLVLANSGQDGGTGSPSGRAPGAHGSPSRAKRGTAVNSGKRAVSSPPKSSSVPAPKQPLGPDSRQGAEASQAVAASAAQLNDRGFQLMNAGRYEQAIPLLRRAVSASSPDSKGLTHAYALFNLGRSLRLAGRPQDAIPLLERRLQIDNQRATVTRELHAAQRSVPSTGGARPGS
jgi:tetratricopeptide (TPR) repeat protein